MHILIYLINICFSHSCICYFQIKYKFILLFSQVEHKEDENQPISDANSEVKMPTDYEGIMKLSKNRLQWTPKEEVYNYAQWVLNQWLLQGRKHCKSIWTFFFLSYVVVVEPMNIVVSEEIAKHVYIIIV